MIEAYTIGITLALENGVSEGLNAIRGDLALLEKAATDAGSKLAELAAPAETSALARLGQTIAAPMPAPEPKPAVKFQTRPAETAPTPPLSAMVAATPSPVQTPSPMQPLPLRAATLVAMPPTLAPRNSVEPSPPPIPSRPLSSPATAPAPVSATPASPRLSSASPPARVAVAAPSVAPGPLPSSSAPAPPPAPVVSASSPPPLGPNLSPRQALLPRDLAAIALNVPLPRSAEASSPVVNRVNAHPSQGPSSPLRLPASAVVPTVAALPTPASATYALLPNPALAPAASAAPRAAPASAVAPAGPVAVAGAAASGAICGDVFLDGERVGQWLGELLAREASRPLSGATGFDPRLSPSWPGAPVSF